MPSRPVAISAVEESGSFPLLREEERETLPFAVAKLLQAQAEEPGCRPLVDVAGAKTDVVGIWDGDVG